MGTWPIGVGLTIVAAIGVLVSTFYGVAMVQHAFHGPNRHGWRAPDLVGREALALVPMMAVLLWLGWYPQPVFNAAAQSVETIANQAAAPVIVEVRRQ
jgi:NADH-quinone oxidoreductase subunit M